MKTHAVIIAGGGPTGLVLAGELALAGVDVAVVERRADQTVQGGRAGGLHPRTIEVFDQRGIAERFIAQGKAMQIGYDVTDAPTRHNYVLALWQEPIERTLAAWVDELAVPIIRRAEVVGFVQDDAGVDVTLSDGTSMRAQYLVGCDGGRSRIRKQAGIAFPGWAATTSRLIAEASMRDEPVVGQRVDDHGIHGITKLEGDRVRVLSTERHVVQGAQPTEDELRAALVAVYGTDFGLHDITYLSRFTDATRQAEAYRDRRVLLAGDAAHVHSPVGGQGLNLGVQDAVNLGWKLALVVHGRAPDSLLDSYHHERHPVGARVLQGTMAATALQRGDARSVALREQVEQTLQLDEPRRRHAARMSGLDVHYDLGLGHALLGRRMPDLELRCDDGVRRTYTLLHEARPVLLELGAPTLDVDDWSDRVQLVRARYDGAWELPLIGEIEAPTAVLVRPDGYVAWVGEGDARSLRAALAKWFGPPAAPTQRYFHGTKADLQPGDLIEAGRSSNYGARKPAKFVYLSATLEAAVWGAELAFGDARERIYIVEPTGPIADDPNLTDKRFPGNPTKSYRTRDALRVVGEITEWTGHPPEQLQATREHLARLKAQGIEAIED